MFKSHLEMIGRNETPSKKAKFWTSYIRSLKGSEDIRAHETPRLGRPYSSYLDAPATYRSIFDEPVTAQDRVLSHGYRYLPVSRDTYGYSPRAIYDHHYSRTIPATYEAERAWNEHLRRMQEIERRYPSRYGLYLKDKPYTPHSLVPLEFEPEDKMLHDLNRARRSPSPMVGPNRVKRAGSEPYVPPPTCWSRGPSPPRGRSMTRGPSVFDRATSLAPFTRPLFRASSLEPLDELFARLPIFHPRNRFRDMFDPNPAMPISAFTRDPFWWDIEDLAPFRAGSPFRGLSLPPRGSSVARDSFLSPVKNRYLWAKHPARPLTPEQEDMNNL
uniref:Zeelin1 n=1 Tax=Glossina morsitans morsitans TaxID=37546 RepID=D3TSC6_GLOMM